MRVVESKVQVNQTDRLIISLLLSFSGILMASSLELPELTNTRYGFEIPTLFVFFTVSSLVPYLLTYPLFMIFKFDTERIHKNWEKKNPDSKLIFEISLETRFNQYTGFRLRLFKFYMYLIPALILTIIALLPVPSLIYILFQEEISLGDTFFMTLIVALIVIPMTTIQLWIVISRSFNHLRIYSTSNKIIIREALIKIGVTSNRSFEMIEKKDSDYLLRSVDIDFQSMIFLKHPLHSLWIWMSYLN